VNAPVATNQRWTADWANVRERRSVEAPVVLVLDPNEAVQVDSLRGGWWAAYVGGQRIGYVANSVLREQPNTP
jgi:hypothetical protein